MPEALPLVFAPVRLGALAGHIYLGRVECVCDSCLARGESDEVPEAWVDVGGLMWPVSVGEA